MWRLQHGQLYMKHQPQLLVVMIGTNDLGAAACLGREPAIANAAGGAADRCIILAWQVDQMLPRRSTATNKHLSMKEGCLCTS